MIEKVQEELSKLSQEATELVAERELLQKRAAEINTRLTQIAGAIAVLSNILKGDVDNE